MNILKKSLAIGAAAAAIAFVGTAASAATDLGTLVSDGAGGYNTSFTLDADDFDAAGNFDVKYSFTLPVSGLTGFQAGITGGTLSSVTFNNQVLVVDPTTNSASFNDAPYAKGTYTFEIAGNGDASGIVTGSVSLAPTAVPEPATWALMIGGVGVAGGALRRRKRDLSTLATA